MIELFWIQYFNRDSFELSLYFAFIYNTMLLYTVVQKSQMNLVQIKIQGHVNFEGWQKTSCKFI